MSLADRALRIDELLTEAYPDARCELDFADPWQLLVATVLSAQCTDKRVNTVTPRLFAEWPSVGHMARAAQDEVELVVRPTGFFRNKARNLRETAMRIVREHHGEVPARMDALVKLPGVGRKTAKVVLGEAFGIAAGVTVDTHVRRLSNRLGLSRVQDPEKIAGELETLLPRDRWIRFSTRMILHGRRVCSARVPACASCTLADLCPSSSAR